MASIHYSALRSERYLVSWRSAAPHAQQTHPLVVASRQLATQIRKTTPRRKRSTCLVSSRSNWTDLTPNSTQDSQTNPTLDRFLESNEGCSCERQAGSGMTKK